MIDTLAAILTAKREHVLKRKAAFPEGRLIEQAQRAAPPRGFRKALENKISQGQFGLIAEIKKASPSGGIIRADFYPAALAQAYEKGGAACLSVLTDEPYFQGKDDYLKEARNAAPLPALRKDFMLDPYQIVESRALGADCILLIMAALSDAQAAELETAAFSLGMDALVEVHDRQELDRALRLQSTLIGINNRNLKTLQVDLATSETLAKHLPANILPVCESGIQTHDDLRRMKNAGISCFLVGESLMRQADVAKATGELLGQES
ncbi:MAG: indole-3-glycerol phosphate synthase TrpC [Pseudomonadota bacterium]|nr:indole-3-glycerol phosphate synthase TrpC [Pseudomonadota bacterium]